MEKLAPADYPIKEEIKRRWSPRAFQDKRVEKEKIQKVFEAGRWAASSYNDQPWRFIIAQKGDPHYEKLFSCLLDWNQGWAKTAPLVGVSIAVKHSDKTGKINPYARHDVGQAMGTLLIEASSEGLLAHQMGGFDSDKVVERFNLDTEKVEPVAMFVIGYGAEPEVLDSEYQEDEKKERKRKPLTEFVFGEKFDKPSSLIS
jgi:nitroreductase